MAKQTVTEALAAVMELKNPGDREKVSRWLARAVRAGLWLDADSIRRSSADELAEMFDGKTP